MNKSQDHRDLQLFPELMRDPVDSRCQLIRYLQTRYAELKSQSIGVPLDDETGLWQQILVQAQLYTGSDIGSCGGD
jgi:hypothetical protein